MIQEFCNWLVDTPLSHLIADNIWIIAITQSIHIMTITVIMLGAVMLNLRLLGVAGRSQSFSAMASHFLPWIWVSLVILLITGTILTIAEPGRELLNAAFRIKMVLILIVTGITVHYGRMLRQDAHYWDPGSGHSRKAAVLASLSLFIWVGIVVCGRLIAYMDLRQMQ